MFFSGTGCSRLGREREVLGSDSHGVNGHPPFVVEDQHDDLKKVPGLVWPDDEETVGRKSSSPRSLTTSWCSTAW